MSGRYGLDVHLSHRQIALAERELDPIFYDSNGGLAAGGNTGATIRTGIHTGWVHVEIDVRSEPPTSEPDGEWEESAEVAFHAPIGEVRVTALDEEPKDTPTLTPAGPGVYRARVHAWGRGANPDGVDFEPHERYFIEVWPETV